jgi:hypothetical protein|tara:strand:+ start:995 stop:1459 length:465 start_codon:yes stop_codon:yes gene_type:complete
MKKYLLFIFFLGLLPAQKNNFYTELGGAGYLTTLNYERMITKNILTRVGFGTQKGETEGNRPIKNDIIFYPLGLSYLLKSDTQNMEYGIGTTILKGTLTMNGESVNPNSKMFFISGGIQKFYNENRFLIKLKGYYLFLGKFSAPWAGISLGFSI